MDDAQEEKYARYVAEIERILANPNPEAGSNSNVIVGLLARLALVALHPRLDEGYSLKTALQGGTVCVGSRPRRLDRALPPPQRHGDRRELDGFLSAPIDRDEKGGPFEKESPLFAEPA
ncbi:MAG TPA: hypothetical protein PKW35_18965 [Nannocystaceae bacterium]|nr:hypothetical protein [Nannocystaceae bacterium]